MKASFGLFSTACLALSALIVGCSDDSTAPLTPTPMGGNAGKGSGGTPSGGTFGAGGFGTGGTAGGFGTGGSAGTTAGSAGSGGTTAGSAGAAGTGGTPIPNEPARILVDSVIVRLKGTGEGGTGNEGGAPGSDGGMGGETSIGGAAGEGGMTGLGGAAGEGPASAGAPGDAGAPGNAGAPGSGGSGGLPSYARSFTFDTALQGFALHAEGSTPNIGANGGTEKLSARSSLTFFADDGSPAPGSMRMTVPFSFPAEQVDVHQIFASAGQQENWSGYELIAKLKVIETGTIGDCLAAWLYATSDGFSFGRGAEVSLAGGQWTDLRFDLDAPDVEGSHDDFDKTTVNQFGLHVQSNNCP